MGHETDVLIATGFLAIMFGFAYNRFVEWFSDNHDPHSAYKSLLVAGGNVGSLAFAAVAIGIADALWVLAAFACTGIPMILGSINRALARASLRVENMAAEGDLMIDDIINEVRNGAA